MSFNYILDDSIELFSVYKINTKNFAATREISISYNNKFAYVWMVPFDTHHECIIHRETKWEILVLNV